MFGPMKSRLHKCNGESRMDMHGLLALRDVTRAAAGTRTPSCYIWGLIAEIYGNGDVG